jgi:hypothetical protein
MNKYRNVKTIVDGITFHSKKEAARYNVLKILNNAGEIAYLELQPRYNIVIKSVKICAYVADFRYKDKYGNLYVEDVKGVKTSAYQIKKKLIKAIYNIDILET